MYNTYIRIYIHIYISINIHTHIKAEGLKPTRINCIYGIEKPWHKINVMNI